MQLFDSVLKGTSPDIRALLESCLQGRELSWADAVTLCGARGPDLHALCLTADELRRRQVGDVGTYVVNRNINFTNVCVKGCRFCAFSRAQKSYEGYFLDEEEIVRRVLEAKSFGATEVCLQAGLAPRVDGRIYVRLCRAIKAAAPDIHIHAFSPEEVKYGAGLTGLSFRDYLEELKDAGLGSLPGTSAEILEDDVRFRLAPERISTAEWIEVIQTAHRLGIPTTSTIMYGHIETDAQRMRHLDLLRSLQKETGGFTEFVPLSFVHEEAPMFLRGSLPDLRPGPTGNEVVRFYAIARLMLGATFRNIQASWVKEGLRQAQWLLSCGANDLGGTLMNESISTAAGASHGQFVPPSRLRAALRDAGRMPAQRNTKYGLLKTFAADGADEAPEPLDAIEDPDKVFGSYEALTQDTRFRFRVIRPAESSAVA
jgi:FO synthase subunit 2